MVEIDAYTHIRSDIQEFRDKFGKSRPNEPCVLISMNFSSRIFTGFTVAKAMLGDVGVDIDRETMQAVSDIHHLPQGNAQMTKSHNRSISGILVFDWKHRNHYLFTNPFADHTVPDCFFLEVRIVSPTRESLGSGYECLNDIVFWGNNDKSI